jgi:hypothetical protein
MINSAGEPAVDARYFFAVMQSMTYFERSSILTLFCAARFSQSRIFFASFGDVIFCGALGFMDDCAMAAPAPNARLNVTAVSNAIRRGMTDPPEGLPDVRAFCAMRAMAVQPRTRRTRT